MMNQAVMVRPRTAQNPVKANRQFVNVFRSKRVASKIPNNGNAEIKGQIARRGKIKSQESVL
jgi:hypothetical protein